MNNIYKPFQSLYQQPMQTALQPTPAFTQIKYVNGPQGANNMRLAPNASELVMDSTEDRIFMLVSDASGYVTVTPLRVSIEQPEKAPDQRELIEKLDLLTGRVEKLEGRLDGKHSTQNDQ